MAELEELESPDRDRARDRALDWRTRAAAAPPTPFWLCARCDHPASGWSVRCLHCDAVGSLTWHQPVAGTISAILNDGSSGGVTDAVVIESAVVDDTEQRRAEQRLAALAHAARGGSTSDDSKAS